MAKESLPDSKSKIKICSVADCLRDVEGLGYCQNHRRQFKKYGDPLVRRQVNGGTLEDRFWAYVQKGNPDECWLWNGTVRNNGYGAVNFQYKAYAAHRVSYFIANGRWPSQCVLHSCDNPPCVNPAHLRDGSIKENVQDALDRGQHPIGERTHNALLKNSDIKEIWRMIWAGMNNTEIAQHFPVTRDTISLIRCGKRWKQVSDKFFTADATRIHLNGEDDLF